MNINKVFKRAVVSFAAIAMVSGLTLFSADNPRTKPKSKKGAKVITVKGSSRHWKDADKTTLDKRQGPRKMKPILNFQNPKRIVKTGAKADTAVQTSVTGEMDRGGMLMPTPITHFAGMNFNQNGAGWPPDTCGDVGINHYVQAVNTSIGIYKPCRIFGSGNN